jgi:hypothetical protein
MGFRIFVVGSGGFSHARPNVPYGDEWNLSWVERQILGRTGIRHRSATGAGTIHAVRAMSRIVQVHLLVDAIAMLMVNHQDGILNVHIRHEHLIGPDTSGFLRLALTGPDPGWITRDLCRFLDRYDMNQWGVMIEILDVLTRFDAHYAGGSGYMINISLSD